MAIKTKEDVQKRVIAYSKVFSKENVFTEEVLKDLAQFCRATETCFHPDPRIHAAMEGRREVWLRIQESIQLTHDEVFKLHRVHLVKGEL